MATSAEIGNLWPRIAEGKVSAQVWTPPSRHRGSPSVQHGIPKVGIMNDRTKACRVYCDAKAEGKSNAEGLKLAQKVTQIGHALVGLAWYADTRNPAHTPVLEVSVDQRPVAAVLLRDGKGWNGELVGKKLSWGRICIALGMFNPEDARSPEGQVRSLFSVEAKISSEGTRIGAGGRWLNGEPRFYTGNHKSLGVEDAKPRQLDPNEVMAGADTYKSKLDRIAAAKARAAAKASK
jgi:hypothetical protein